MSSFKDYFFSQQSGDKKLLSLRPQDKALLTLKDSISDISASINTVGEQAFSIEQKEKFSNELSQLVQSKELIEEFSTKIGEPLPNETEDEFVKRAKASMRELLSQKLS